MSHYPTISIVTPSFNQGEFIEETIASVLSQEGDFFIDYLIMDGGSTDTTLDVIRSFEELLESGNWLVSCRGIRFRWASEQDGGQADAINKGFALAEGTILGWLNSDDIYYPGALGHAAALDWLNTDFCYGKGMWISRNGRELYPYPTFMPNRYALYYHCTLCQPTVFFNRKTYRDLGAFSLEYQCSFDYEYWLRAAEQDMKFQFISELLAQSRIYPQNKSLSFHSIVQEEITELKEKYYANFKLNPVVKAYYRLWVSFRTNLRNQALTARLAAEE